MTGKLGKAVHGSLLCVCLMLGFALSAQAEEIIIDVAPNVLNIQSEGQVVTVHTDIAYGAVDVSSVYLNGILIKSYKADARGYFVAKFSMLEVKELVQEGYLELGEIELVLEGLTKDGEEFWGSQVITVINIIPSKRT